MAIDAQKWTSDWQIGREIHTAYEDSRRTELCIICPGHPRRADGFLLEPVGEALAEYHPHVFGTPENPVHAGNLAAVWAEHGELWESAFVLVIAPRGSGDEDIGFVVPSRAPWMPRPAVSSVPHLGHLVLYANVFFAGMEDAGVPANPHLERRAHEAAHVIVDGVLRFFHKINYDHTRHASP